MKQMLFAISLSLAAVPVITLERGACYGFCPVYKLTIFDNGKVVYEGKDYVKQKGRAEARITKAALQTLIGEFNKIDYFKLEDEYVSGEKTCPQEWTDAPSAVTSLSLNGKTKRIRHYHGCRGTTVLEQLTALENKIDEVVNTKRWIK